MADTAISALTELTSPAVGDLIPIVDISEATTAIKTKKITLANLVNGSLLIPDGTGLNYKLYVATSSGNCYITIIPSNSAAYSATNFSAFNINGTILKVTDTPSNIGLGGADYFDWIITGVAGNDAQLFIYTIDNDGTLALGASASPNLTVVANNYRLSGGTQVGNRTFGNMCLSSATMVSGSPCRVIGRVNVNQGTDSAWVNPTTAKIISTPIFETNVMALSFKTPADPTPSAITLKYAIKKDRAIIFGDAENVSVSGAGAVMSIYLPAVSTMTKVKASASVYDTSWKTVIAYVLTDTNQGAVHLTKSNAGAGWAGNETGVFINFTAEYPINE